jgi:subtilisin-like proprotein convertase family protein
MKKIYILTLLSSITFFGFAQTTKEFEFDGAQGAISPLLVPDIPPPPTLPLPFPNPVPDINSYIPVLNTYTAVVDSIGRINLNELVGVKLDIVHPSVEELRIILFSPFGTQLILVDTLPNGGANMEGTIFTLDAAQRISEGEAPYAGAFLPEQAPPGLNNFLFEEANGEWTLGIQVRPSFQVVPGSPGTLNSWSLVFEREIEDTTTNSVKNAAYSFELFPNPSSEFVRINRTNAVDMNDVLNIYNSMGQLVKSQNAGNANLNIDVSDLAEGLYFTEIRGKLGTSQQKLVIKH